MVIGMGFATNSTVLPALVGKGDLIISDQLNHTSIVQGARESGAKIKPFCHNDAADLELVLQEAVKSGKYNKILLVIEGIYSMEGDLCNLKEIVPVAKQYGAYIYLDEAHSIGAIGPSGRGVTEELGIDTKQIDIMMGTFSKSFGSSGGYIAGDKKLVNHVRKYAAGCTDACPLPPACTVQIIEALKLIRGADGTDIGQRRLKAIRHNSIFFRRRLEEMGLEVLGDAPSPVIPVMLYTPSKIGDFSRLAFRRNLAVVTVGAPAVPLMYGRVRFCISAAHSQADLEDALLKIEDIADELKLRYRTVHAPNLRFPGTLDSLEHKFSLEKKQRQERAKKGRKDALATLKTTRWAPLVAGENDDGKPVFGWYDRKINSSTSIKANISSWDYHGFANNPSIQAACIRTLDQKGLGSCGPRGFYGTYPEHLQAERDLAAFLETEQAVLYPFGACTVSSVISCMAGKGDVLVVDEGVGRNVLTGISLSRAEVRFYKHCDPNDCERVLRDLSEDEWRNIKGSGFKPKRCFLISEAVFGSTGKLAPLRSLCAMRTKYRCRFILDETHSFGLLGASGRGATEHFGLKPTEVDVICASLEGMASCCGFATGATGVVSYQRLLGSGYCYSAAPPPYLATSVSAALASIRKLGKERLERLKTITNQIRDGIKQISGLEVCGSRVAPMMSVSLSAPASGKCEARAILEKICHECQKEGLAISMFNNRPSIGFRPKGVEFPAAIRVCASSGLSDKQVSFALSTLKSVTTRVLTNHKAATKTIQHPTPDLSNMGKDLKEETGSAAAAPLSQKPASPKTAQLGDKSMEDEVTVYKTDRAISEGNGGFSVPLLMLVWAFLSLYKRFLQHESEITSRFVDRWLHMLGLDRNATSPSVRAFFFFTRVLGSHQSYSILLPVIFWCFGATSSAALPFIFYCLLCSAGCILKCVMSENKNDAYSWPSITAMNAVGLPFFLLRYFFGQAWLYNAFTVNNLAIAIAGVIWVVMISFSSMQRGDSPSNVIGGLVAGSIGIHVMIQFFCEPTLSWLSGDNMNLTCPPLLFGLAMLCFCPLPDRELKYTLKMYQHLASHMAAMFAFMLGTKAIRPSSTATDAFTTNKLMVGAFGVIVLFILQLCARWIIRRVLTSSLSMACNAVPSIRRYAVKTFETTEPILRSISYGFFTATVVPVALNVMFNQ
mmetsp:Transcript_1619/g.2410  ORF Transcript_1619/g.2410 Transcript_1619/m.2410 type:complete len:1177 (-) Transcript_1619:132-3662(-)